MNIVSGKLHHPYTTHILHNIAHELMVFSGNVWIVYDIVLVIRYTTHILHSIAQDLMVYSGNIWIGIANHCCHHILTNHPVPFHIRLK